MSFTKQETTTTTIAATASLFDDGVLFAVVEAKVKRYRAGLSQLSVAIRYTGEPTGEILTNRSMSTRNRAGIETDLVAMREDITRAEAVAQAHYKRSQRKDDAQIEALAA